MICKHCVYESGKRGPLRTLGGSLAGAVVGDELSRGTAHVQPLLGVSGSGAVLGLGGQF